MLILKATAKSTQGPSYTHTFGFYQDYMVSDLAIITLSSTTIANYSGFDANIIQIA